MKTPEPKLDRLAVWTLDETAAYLRVFRRKFDELRRREDFPKATGRGGIFYDASDIFDWLDQKVAAAENAPPPEPVETILYRHFNAAGELLYVGISLTLLMRTTHHKGRSSWFDQVTRIELERWPSREAALAAELHAIREEKPIHNVVGAVA